MNNIIIIPYVSEDEFCRLMKIGHILQRRNVNLCNYEYLLLTKKTVKPSRELEAVFSSIAPTRCHELEITTNSYPEGVSEFFWKAMDYINKYYEKDGGFVLWMESDMVPIAPDWVDVLDAEWREHPGVLSMGLYVPKTYYIELKCCVSPHINGGACYSKDLSGHIADKYRRDFFDVSLFQSLGKTKKYHGSNLFKFSHMASLPEDIREGEAVILHGYAQDKDVFVQKAIEMIEHPERLEVERLRLSKIDKKNKICCKYNVTMFGMTACPVHNMNWGLTLLFRLLSGLLRR